MMKELKKYYDAFANNKAAYKSIRDNEKLAEDLRKEMIEALRGTHRDLVKDVEGRGSRFCKMYKLYESMMDRENEVIDLSDPHEFDDAAEVVAMFREFGVSEFALASGWSGANEAAWSLTQEGCTVAGMVEINSQYKEFMSDEFEKVHGFLFNVN